MRVVVCAPARPLPRTRTDRPGIATRNSTIEHRTGYRRTAQALSCQRLRAVDTLAANAIASPPIALCWRIVMSCAWRRAAVAAAALVALSVAARAEGPAI